MITSHMYMTVFDAMLMNQVVKKGLQHNRGSRMGRMDWRWTVCVISLCDVDVQRVLHTCIPSLLDSLNLFMFVNKPEKSERLHFYGNFIFAG